MIKDFKIFEFQQLPKKVKVDKSDRIIYSNDKEIKFKNISLNRQKEDNWGFKPLGLWYGFGDDWLKHIVRAGFDRDYSTIFKINITHNILILNTREDIFKFSEEYGIIKDWLESGSGGSSCKKIFRNRNKKP